MEHRRMIQIGIHRLRCGEVSLGLSDYSGMAVSTLEHRWMQHTDRTDRQRTLLPMLSRPTWGVKEIMFYTDI